MEAMEAECRLVKPLAPRGVVEEQVQRRGGAFFFGANNPTNVLSS